MSKIMSGRAGENIEAIRERWPFGETEVEAFTFGDILDLETKKYTEDSILQREFERA